MGEPMKWAGYDPVGLGYFEKIQKAVEDGGCHIIFLGTWDFQARPFYEKHGYLRQLEEHGIPYKVRQKAPADNAKFPEPVLKSY